MNKENKLLMIQFVLVFLMSFFMFCGLYLLSQVIDMSINAKLFGGLILIAISIALFIIFLDLQEEYDKLKSKVKNEMENN